MTETRPIFVAAVPRACSTAFERVFMTCPDQVECIHEPFGEPYYFGPERLGRRFNAADQAYVRSQSGHDKTTYRHVFDQLADQNRLLVERRAQDGLARRLFIKDIGQYLIPQSGRASEFAPSLVGYSRSIDPVAGDTISEDSDQGTNKIPTPTSASSSDQPREPANPTVVPTRLLGQFQFAFLIRHPQSSIPSYFRCTIPPLSASTGFTYFDPLEAGFAELRALFDYVRSDRSFARSSAGAEDGNQVIVVDADDLLDNPSGYVAAFCDRVGLEYSPSMLEWGSTGQDQTEAQAEAQAEAEEKFRKWKGFHEDAITSTGLKARAQTKKIMTDDECLAAWTKSYGADAAEQILDCVRSNLEHYNHMKQFAIKVVESPVST